MSESQKSRPFWRDPLFHFVLIGAAVFGADRLLNRGEAATEDRTVYVGAGDIERLASVWEERWGRPPTDAERSTIVDDFVREEILYREAVSMGLDEDDTIVRRRLAQKLAFVSQGREETAPMDEAGLRAWFEANRRLYETQPRYTFVQILFSRTARGEAAEADARAALDRLTATGATAEPPAGDESAAAKFFSDAARTEIAAVFGDAFASQLEAAGDGAWIGPIESALGYHLVFIRQRAAGYTPTFQDVRDAVESDWLAEQSRAVDPAFFEDLKQRYDVVFEDGVRAAS